MAKTGKRRGLVVPLLLVVGLVVAAVDVFPVRQLIALNGEGEVVRARLTEIEGENARLEREIQALYSSSEIERIARADFGYVRPGETSYVVIVEEAESQEEEAEPVPEPLPESGGFWEALWDYLTGRDIIDG